MNCIKGNDILRLIPQRNPFVMVDEFERRDGQTAATRLHIRTDNYFLLADGTLAETGVIEHIAQSCSALAAANAQPTDAERPPIGMIAELKHFTCRRRPCPGETLETLVSFGFSFGAMTLAHGTTYINGEQIAEINLKIYMQ